MGLGGAQSVGFLGRAAVSGSRRTDRRYGGASRSIRLGGARSVGFESFLSSAGDAASPCAGDQRGRNRRFRRGRWRRSGTDGFQG